MFNKFEQRPLDCAGEPRSTAAPDALRGHARRGEEERRGGLVVSLRACWQALTSFSGEKTTQQADAPAGHSSRQLLQQ